MSFLDNLENTLKNNESREERADTAGGRKNQKQMEAERAKARSIQPLVDELKKGKFTADLLNEVTRLAHGLRTKVYITWIGTTLRLEAREHRLELAPTPDGVVATTLVNASSTGSHPVDLKKSAKPLAEKWMQTVGPRPEPKIVEAE